MYQIIIKKIEEVKRIEQEYRKIADSGNEEDNGAVYGYVSTEVEKEESKEIYNQSVEKEIDLFAVIKSFNGEK